MCSHSRGLRSPGTTARWPPRGRGWEAVTECAIRALVARPQPMVAILWGRNARNLKPLLAERVIGQDHALEAVARVVELHHDLVLADVDRTQLVEYGAERGRLDVAETVAKVLFESDEAKSATDMSADGRVLLFRSLGPGPNWDIWALPLTGERKPVPYLQTPFAEEDGVFAPVASDTTASSRSPRPLIASTALMIRESGST